MLILNLENLSQDTPSAVCLRNLKDIENALNTVNQENLDRASASFEDLDDLLKHGRNPMNKINEVIDILVLDGLQEPNSKPIGIVKGLKDSLSENEKQPIYQTVALKVLIFYLN